MPLFRQAVGELPLIAAGKVWSRADADAVLALGADAVAIGRAAICWAEWPEAAQDPTWNPAHPPLPLAHMQQQELSPAFLRYLGHFRLVAE